MKNENLYISGIPEEILSELGFDKIDLGDYKETMSEGIVKLNQLHSRLVGYYNTKYVNRNFWDEYEL